MQPSTARTSSVQFCSNTYLLNEVNTRLKVEPKVNEIPFDALLAVLLLFQHKHVMVEELLQLLIGQVDAQLLKGVHLEHNHRRSHKPCNIFTNRLPSQHN